MALYRYFQPAADSPPDPRGPLSKIITSSTIVEANEAVATKQPAKMGTYTKFTVAQFASMHGIAAAKRRFSKEVYADLKESMIHTTKTKYLAEISHKKRSHVRALS